MSSEHNCLNVKDVCAIIEASAQHGLLSLKWNGLELTFKEERSPRKEIIKDIPIETSSQGHDEETPTTSPEVLQQIEQDVKQAEVEQMLINDPALFEELLSSGEIENEENRRTESNLP